jgi:hypothetical protein
MDRRLPATFARIMVYHYPGSNFRPAFFIVFIAGANGATVCFVSVGVYEWRGVRSALSSNHQRQQPPSENVSALLGLVCLPKETTVLLLLYI